MWRFLPYVLKSLWRQRTRTALTVGGAAVALFVFTFVGAVQEGLDALTSSSQLDRTLIVFQANRFCPFTSRLPEPYAQQLRKLPGVAAVYPIQVYTNNCRASLDVVVFHGIPPDMLQAARAMKLEAGDWQEFRGKRDAAMVGQALAKRRGLSVGQRFTVGGVTVLVAGIYSAATAAEESYLYTHLDFLQRTRGLSAVGTVTQFEVLLTEGAAPPALCRQIDAHFRSGGTATDTRPKSIFQRRAVGDLVPLIRFAGYLGFACVGLVLALVATTTVMAVQDRVREYAVLQTLGYTSGRIFSFVIAESLLVSVLGGLLGVGLALLSLTWGRFAVGTEGVTIAFTASPMLACTGLAVTALVGVGAGLLPALQAARADIVTSLRAL